MGRVRWVQQRMEAVEAVRPEAEMEEPDSLSDEEGEFQSTNNL